MPAVKREAEERLGAVSHVLKRSFLPCVFRQCGERSRVHNGAVGNDRPGSNFGTVAKRPR
jgi:hypothetical protein